MDPELQQLSYQLAEVAARNAASSVTDRLRTIKARRQTAETVSELEEIVYELLEDRPLWPKSLNPTSKNW